MARVTRVVQVQPVELLPRARPVPRVPQGRLGVLVLVLLARAVTPELVLVVLVVLVLVVQLQLQPHRLVQQVALLEQRDPAMSRVQVHVHVQVQTALSRDRATL